MQKYLTAILLKGEKIWAEAIFDSKGRCQQKKKVFFWALPE